MPSAVLAVAGPVAIALAWLVIRTRGVSLWIVNGALLPTLGVAALLTATLRLSGRFSAAEAFGLGLASGAAFYLATTAFMAVAGRWPPLARHTSALYENRGDIPLVAAILISVLLVAPGEELLWRGAILDALSSWTGSEWVAGGIVWAGYVAANAVSGSLPIVLGALVGGAVWTVLAVWTDGVAASVACHAVWTGLMIARPPVPR